MQTGSINRFGLWPESEIGAAFFFEGKKVLRHVSVCAYRCVCIHFAHLQVKQDEIPLPDALLCALLWYD